MALSVYIVLGLCAVCTHALVTPGSRPRRTCDFENLDPASDGISLPFNTTMTCPSGCTCTAAVPSFGAAGAYFVAMNAHGTLTCQNNSCVHKTFKSNGTLTVNCPENACIQTLFQTNGTIGASVNVACSGPRSCNQAQTQGPGVIFNCTGSSSCTQVQCGYENATVLNCDAGSGDMGGGDRRCGQLVGPCQYPNGTFVNPGPYRTTTASPEVQPGLSTAVVASETTIPAITIPAITIPAITIPAITIPAWVQPGLSTAAVASESTIPAWSHDNVACPGSVSNAGACRSWCGPNNFMMWTTSSFTGSGGNTGGYTCKCANNNLCNFGSSRSFTGGGGDATGDSTNSQGGQGGQGGRAYSSSSSISVGGVIAAVGIVLVGGGAYVVYRHHKKQQRNGGNFEKLNPYQANEHENPTFEDVGDGASASPDTLTTEYARY